jgi:phenylacetate-coenzyme A ligase PaaK-like adenylate-forming protein
MADYFDTLEIRDPEEREREQLARLARQIAYARAQAPAFTRILADVDVASITTRAALAQVPVTRKSALLELQKSARPFGGLAATGWGDALRVFASPGPIYEPEGRRPDYWRLARALFAAGFRRGDLVHNCFSYHFTPAGSMLETGAHALGCTVFPAGTGQTEQQVQAMAELRPAGYVGTPSFLRNILEKADEMGIALPEPRQGARIAEPFRKVSATPCSPAASPATRSMHRPTSARSLRPRRARGSSSTKAFSWKSSGPAPATGRPGRGRRGRRPRSTTRTTR